MRLNGQSIAFSTLALGILAALIGQSVQPFHLLTHEFTQLFSLVTLGLGVAIGMRMERSLRPVDALAATLGAVGLFGVGAFSTQLLLNHWVHDCVVSHAIPFFWVTWTPLGVLGAVLGVSLAERGWSGRRVALMVVVLGLMSGLHDGLQFLNGVRIVDPLIGDPQAFNQRSSMAVSDLHIWQRVWLLSVAVAVWTALRSQRRVIIALGLAPMLLLTFGAGSHIGVGWGRAALRTSLDATLETEHFVFQYGSKGAASLQIDRIARDGAWYWSELTEAWQVDPQHKVRIRVFENDKQLKRLTGLSAAHAGLYQVDIPLGKTHTSTYPHELVHALHAELSWNPRLIWSRGMVEGTAVAWADHFAVLPEAHAGQAGALQSDTLPSAVDFMSPGGFSKVNEGNAYSSAGSFVGFLVLEFGLESFIALQKNLDYVGVYGMDLAALDTRWRTFLADVPVDLAEAASARDRYDPDLKESYSSKQCPKLGSRKEAPKDRARRMYRDGDFAGAAKIYERLLRSSGKTRWARFAVSSYRQLESHEEVVALTDAQLAREDLDDDERFQLLQLQLAAHVAREDFASLYAAYDARSEVDASPDAYRRNVEQCLRDVEIRDDVLAFLNGRLRDLGRDFLIDLSIAHPEHDALSYLVAARSDLLPYASSDRFHFTDSQWEQLDKALVFLERAPQACDELSWRLLSLADLGLRIGSPLLTERAATAVQAFCADPVAKHRAVLRLERLAWEATQSSDSPPGSSR